MTWLKLSDDYSDLMAKANLSDAAYRTHTEALGWVMRRETDGRITDRDIRRFAESPDADRAVKELVTVGFWAIVDGGYLVIFHMQHQPESEVIERRRQLDAERQRRMRRKRAGLDVDVPEEESKPMKSKVAKPSRRDATRDSNRDSNRDNTRDPGRVGTGRDGKTPPLPITEEKEIENGEPEPEEDWPTTAVPGAARCGGPGCPWTNLDRTNGRRCDDCPSSVSGSARPR